MFGSCPTGHTLSTLTIPFHAILRGILNADSMAVAIGAVTKPRRASAGNYLIGKAGEAFDIEAGPTTFNFICPGEGLMTHANHFQKANPAIRDAIPSLWPDSLVRDFRASKLLKAEHPRITYLLFRICYGITLTVPTQSVPTPEGN
jgi:hypothetical protein